MPFVRDGIDMSDYKYCGIISNDNKNAKHTFPRHRSILNLVQLIINWFHYISDIASKEINKYKFKCQPNVKTVPGDKSAHVSGSHIINGF